jgi:VanZ family protein
LLVVWCCFIVYGSLIPFRFSADPDFVRSNLAKVQVLPFQAGVKKFSIPDIASNVLLFIPFGLLLAGSECRVLGRSWPRRICAIGAWALGFAAVIELGQLFAAGRRSSAIDVESDVLGAVVGGVGAYLLQRYGKQVNTCLRAVRAEPGLVPMALVAVWLCADAFYPFAVTLDVSTAWHNLTHAKWIPFREPQAFWLDRVVNEAVVFAILSALIRSALRRHVSALTATAAAVAGAIAFSIALESGKLLVVGRAPNMENVLLASAGAVCGVTLAPLLMAWYPIKRRPEWALAVLALLLLAYSELTPFAFGTPSSAFATQVGRIEWMPLLSYSRADAQSALFDLWRKLLLSGFWGFSFSWVMSSTPWRAACAGLVVGGALEAAQLLTIGRTPSVGDVLILGLGAWIGGIVYRRYQIIHQP